MKILYNIINCLFLSGYWLLITSIIIRIIMKRRTVPSSIAWLLTIYIFPLFGITIYLLFGEFNLDKVRHERSKFLFPFIKKWIKDLKKNYPILINKSSELAKPLFQLCENQQGMNGLKNNKMKILTDTEGMLLSLINDINLAKKNIEIIFYIWQTCGLINKVTQALISAAKRGVNCRLILDSAGSIDFFRSPYPKIMRDAGVNIVEALRISILRIFFHRMDLRQHRKIILIDNCIAYTGSMNMVDPIFFKKESGVGKWIDIMVRMEGPIAIVMGIIFSCDWEIETGERILPSIPNIDIITFKKISKCTIQVIASGPGFPDDIIHQALLISIYAARKKLIITTPYLIPSDSLIYAICNAAQRGVEVHIIIPSYNDSILVRWASKVFFCELLKAGVLIHQFEGGLLHAKSILIDNQLSLIGTVNLDIRSIWLNFEIMLIIDDKNFGNNLEKIQKKYLANSKQIEVKKWLKRPFWQRIIEQLFYFFSPLL